MTTTETRALSLDRGDDDDEAFTDWAARVIDGVLRTLTPSDLHVVKIDSWFGEKWRGFSYKRIGAFGVHNTVELRVPPFIPSRVVRQCNYVRELSGGYFAYRRGPALHIHQTSGANDRRLVSKLFPNAALFWWSGATSAHGRGSLMAYLPISTGHTAWYAELARASVGSWRVSRAAGISAEELAALAKPPEHARD